MRPNHKYLLVTVTCSLGFGALLLAPVITSDNGYVAGFVFLPFLLLIGIISFILLFVGLIMITKKAGPFLLLSALLLPTGFFGAAFIAKGLELGAYREDPMVPVVPDVANKVLFKKEATHEEIERFWTHIIGYPIETGSWSRPGVGGGARSSPEKGHEVITFTLRPEATEEQIADIRTRVNAYPPDHKYLENVDTSPQIEQIEPTNRKPEGPVKQPTKFKYER